MSCLEIVVAGELVVTVLAEYDFFAAKRVDQDFQLGQLMIGGVDRCQLALHALQRLAQHERFDETCLAQLDDTATDAAFALQAGHQGARGPRGAARG